MHAPIRLRPGSKRDFTVAVFDDTARVFEIFADSDCDSYLGCADTLDEAARVAQDWIDET
jgi:hypothetical protein